METSALFATEQADNRRSKRCVVVVYGNGRFVWYVGGMSSRAVILNLLVWTEHFRKTKNKMYAQRKEQ